jgi:DNA polymerase-3 subunit epsilon
MPPEAEAVHGLSSAFLKDKPVFEAIAEEFLAFIADSVLVIHNASFDMAFINAELSYLRKPPLPPERVIDTLQIARQRHPTGPNSLDALCRRYGVDNTKRTKHGALLDSELLAEVYLELIGGRQTALSLATGPALRRLPSAGASAVMPRSRMLPPRLSEAERAQHRAFIESLGEGALWMKSGL